MFSSKTVDDLTESVIHSHRRLIHVRRFTSARTVTTMFSSKTVDDLTESVIHSHRRLIHVRRFTSVH